MRKCRACKARLPKLAESDKFQRIGACTLDCFIAYQKANRQEVRQIAARAREKEHRRQKRESKGNDRKHQFKLTVKVAQRLARLLDKGKPCISCGRPDDGSVQFCGSHYLTKGAHPETAIDLRVIHGACNHYCNLNLSGNIEGNKHTHGFRQGLVQRYGQEIVDFLEGPHPQKKWTCEELQAIRKEYSAEIRRLDRGEKPSRDWRKLDEDSN